MNRSAISIPVNILILLTVPLLAASCGGAGGEPQPQGTSGAAYPIPPTPTYDALGQVTQITTRPAPRGDLAVDGSYVVWGSYEDGRTNIVAYNLATREERRVSSLPGGKSGPRVSGSNVIWKETLDDPSHNSAIHAYNLVAGREMTIGASVLSVDYPDISGNQVVWSDWRHYANGGEVDIYGYDMQSGTEIPVVVRPGRHLFPRISGGWVIYLDWPAGASLAGRSPSQPVLRAHHLNTGEDIGLGPAYFRDDASCCNRHAISGELVVWIGADGQARLYNLTTRQVRELDQAHGFSWLELHGNLLNAFGGLINVETGGRLDFFVPWTSDNPSPINGLATDGRTVAWLFGAVYQEDQVYVAGLRRLP